MRIRSLTVPVLRPDPAGYAVPTGALFRVGTLVVLVALAAGTASGAINGPVGDPPPGITPTGVCTELGVVGEGWFLLRNTADSELYICSRGDFQVDSDCYVVNSLGLRLITDRVVFAGWIRFGEDLYVRKYTKTPVGPWNFRFDSFGRFADHFSTNSGVRQIRLAHLPPPEMLEPVGPYTYRVLGQCRTGYPGSDGLGTLYQGGLSAQTAPLLPTR